MKVLKKIFLFLIILFLNINFIYGLIYDDVKLVNPFYNFADQKFSKNTEFLINNKKVKIKSFLTDTHQGDVIGYYINYAENKGFKIIDNFNIRTMANLFLNRDDKYYNPDFDCVFYLDNKIANFVIASTNFEKTRVIIIKFPVDINSNINTKKIGILKLPDEINGFFHMKLADKNSKFNEFYCGVFNTGDVDFFSKKWLSNLKNEKWQIMVLKGRNKNEKFFLLKKSNKEYFVLISYTGYKLYLSVIG